MIEQADLLMSWPIRGFVLTPRRCSPTRGSAFAVKVDPAGMAPASERDPKTTSPSAAVDDCLTKDVTVGKPSLRQVFLWFSPRNRRPLHWGQAH